MVGNIINFFLLYLLKTTKRKGWLNHGIKGPESIADHMYRMALMGLIAGDLPGVNRERSTFSHIMQKACTLYSWTLITVVYHMLYFMTGWITVNYVHIIFEHFSAFLLSELKLEVCYTTNSLFLCLLVIETYVHFISCDIFSEICMSACQNL